MEDDHAPRPLAAADIPHPQACPTGQPAASPPPAAKLRRRGRGGSRFTGVGGREGGREGGMEGWVDGWMEGGREGKGGEAYEADEQEREESYHNLGNMHAERAVRLSPAPVHLGQRRLQVEHSRHMPTIHPVVANLLLPLLMLLQPLLLILLDGRKFSLEGIVHRDLERVGSAPRVDPHHHLSSPLCMRSISEGMSGVEEREGGGRRMWVENGRLNEEGRKGRREEGKEDGREEREGGGGGGTREEGRKGGGRRRGRGEEREGGGEGGRRGYDTLSSSGMSTSGGPCGTATCCSSAEMTLHLPSRMSLLYSKSLTSSSSLKITRVSRESRAATMRVRPKSALLVEKKSIRFLLGLPPSRFSDRTCPGLYQRHKRSETLMRERRDRVQGLQRQEEGFSCIGKGVGK
eukprot:751679-Hanusia_phi.AAC.3